MMMKLNKPIRFLRPSVQILYPKNSEREYYRLLRAMVRMLNKLSLENIETLKDVLRYDSTDSERISGKVLEELEVSGVKAEVMSGIKRVMKGVDNTAKDNLRRSFRNCLQVDVFINDTVLLESVTSEWYSQQSQHVNSIVSTYTDKLATIVSNAVQRGSLYKDVQKEVKDLYNITDNRAKFIARNEIGNLNAVTTKRRQEEAGIYCYEWRTSEDERVRASHAELNGDLFFWNDSKIGEINGRKIYPAPKLHPGMDYRCRCIAIPIIDLNNWNAAAVTPTGEVKANKRLELSPYEVKEFRFFNKFDDVPDSDRVRKSIIDLDADTGIKFIMPVDLNKKMQNLTKDELLPQIANLPEKLRERIKEVRILDIYCPADEKWIEAYPGFTHAYATAEEYIITFWRNNREVLPEGRLQEILLHECGHLLDILYSGVSSRSKWLKAIEEDTKIHGLPVNEYAKNSPEEDFAESIMIYYTYGSKALAKYYPNRHKILKELLKDD
ncbi:phage minor head protein [Phascolarctobacterium faecium]|uniref:phage minor head protein n=1 Tax=Phascolarctobacterium faecium TaxID=33025 RepID=UPI003F74520A